MAENRKNIFTKMWENVQNGDKMIWIVAVMLMLLSLVAIFSSTSSYAIKSGSPRTEIFEGQLVLVGIGIVLLVFMSAIPNVKYIRVLSQYGFLVSVVLLLMLVGNIHMGNNFRAIEVNGARRAIYMFGFTLQVYEVVKVAMVMYLSWALTAYESNKLMMANYLGTRLSEYLGWMKSARAQRWIYFYVPMAAVMGLTFPGSTSSALMLGIVMGATLLIGGFKIKYLVGIAGLGAAGIALLVMVHIASSGAVIPRMQTAFSRLGIEVPYPDKNKREEQKTKIAAKKLDPEMIYSPGSKEFKEYRDKTLQNNSAEVAFVEGGRRIFGKGPGKSTQKYIVPLIFEDYMFSFLMEEYGLMGGLIIILLYISLFARGVILVGACSGRYARSCVGGLVFLITFQAMLHILINCNVGILTGQTLPMISHGKSSFLCFTIAFGVILSISTMANKRQLKKEIEEGQKMLGGDEISEYMSAAESIDDQIEAMQMGIDIEEEKDNNPTDL